MFKDMLFSNLNLKTVKENPKDIESLSHQLLIRSGLIYQIESGIYVYSDPLTRVIENVKNLISKEMENICASRIQLPILQPANLWITSNRWDVYGNEMFKLDNDQYCLGPTHEEVVCKYISSILSSYKQLPIHVFQIGTKFRNELRPEKGLIRTKEFLMKDSYSFHGSEECLNLEYDLMISTYETILSLLNIKYEIKEADNSQIGGSVSHEFLCPMEDDIIEVAHVFKLGTRYTEPLNITFSTQENSKQYPYMGCYGIGISRLIQVIIGQNCDDKGIIWPLNISPYSIILEPVKYPVHSQLENLAIILDHKYNYHNQSPIIIDDRTELSFGYRIKDAYLLGIPYILIGGNQLDEGIFELIDRTTDHKSFLLLDQVIELLESKFP